MAKLRRVHFARLQFNIHMSMSSMLKEYDETGEIDLDNAMELLRGLASEIRELKTEKLLGSE